MENQHRKITGYRELTQQEIDLMNKIKAHAEATESLLNEVNTHVGGQVPAAENLAAQGQTEMRDRLDIAQPHRWVAMARSDLQVGFMKLVRAVAQPTTF